MLAIVSMVLVSCGGGGSTGVMTPQTTEISGPLGREFEVVNTPVKLHGHTWSIQIKSKTNGHFNVPFGTTKNKYEAYVGFGLETYDKDGSLIVKRSATEGANREDVRELLSLKEGETGFIRWNCLDSEKSVKGMTFKITSARQD